MQYRNIDKEALKTNGYRVLSKITIVGTDIVFTEDDHIVNWNYEDYRYVPNEGFVGQFVERLLDGNLQDISENIILEDTEINLQLGIVNSLDNDTTTWYNYGNFLITKVEKTDTTGNYKFESADYTKKFNKVFDGDYTDTTYTKSFNQKIEDEETVTALWLAQYVCAQAGVILYTTNFTNYNFVISSNQYDSDATCRKVMQDIGKLAYSWVRIAEDNKVHIDFTPKSTSSVDQYDQLTTDEYYVSKKSDLTFGPVNKVLIGMSDVEGENMYETSPDYTPETECAIKIYDNNLTNTDELRALALQGCDRLFGITYTPIEINSVGHPWLDGDELIKLTNLDNEIIYTYPFNRKITYAGYIEGTIGAEAHTIQESKYEYKSDIISNVKKTAVIVDKQEQTITALAEDVSENTSNISTLTISVDGIESRVESIETTEVTAVTNEYAVNTSPTNPPAQSSSSWSTTKPTRGTGEYIWARIKTTYKSGNVEYSDPVNTTGDKGDPGQGGKGISSINNYYKATSTQDEPTASSITSTTIPTMDATNNKYLWQKTVTNYTTGNPDTAVSLIGVYGDKGQKGETGDAGNGISSITYYYATTTTQSAPSAASITSTTIPTLSATNKYLWQKEVIAYTNNTNKTSVLLIAVYGDKGDKGNAGDDGASIDTITEYYAVSSSNTTAPSSWTTDVSSITLTATNKYLWNYTRITYTEGKEPTGSSGDAKVIGVYGDKGQKGENGDDGRGIVSITEYYLATSASSGVTRSTSGWTTTIQTMTSTNKYLWNYEKIVYTSGTTTEYVEPMIIGVYGLKGDPGTAGKGIQSVTELYYVSNSSTAPSKPSSHVTTSSLTTYNAWNLQCPPYTTTYKYFYTCSEVLYTDNTYGWTNVTQNQALAIANENAYNATEAVANIEVSKGNLWFNYQKPKADTTQWSVNPTEVITTGLPESDESTFALRTSGNTLYHVPFSKDKTYKVTAWLKTITSSASSTSYYYPSILPYDMDKQQMNYTDVITIGASTTTLAQDLKNGDTKVYLTSVAGFPTGTATKGYYVGIFDYKSSTGYSYETYTKHIYLFANNGDVLSNVINTTNKTVTLKTAYSGSTIPAGTKVSCTQAGSTYIYPFSGLKYSDTANWTYKERIFDYKYDVRLKEASYIRFYPYTANVYYYGLSLVDYTETKNSTEIIIGTQTGVTGSWTGNASFSELLDGQQIAYWLPYNGSGNASLNLTLSNGTTTGAVPCYYSGASRITTHYAAGNVIHLTFRVNANVAGTNYTGWWADANYVDGNTYDRIRFNQNITAGAAITAGQLIVKVGTTFKPLAASLAFDVTQPVLLAGSDIASGGTNSNTYLSYPGVNITKTVSGLSLTAQNTCYLVGTLNGNMFTTKSSGMLTTTVPSTEDGYYYMSLGYMSSATNMILFPEHPLFKFVNGSFKSLNQVAYDADVKIDTLEIGGRNILRETKTFSNEGVSSTATGYLRGKGTVTTAQSIDDFTVITCTPSSASILGEWLINGCKNGETYTLSFWVKGAGKPRCYFYGPSGYITCEKVITQNGTGNSADGNTDSGAGGVPVSNSEWQRVWVTWKLKDTGGTTDQKYVLIRNDNKVEVYVAGAKFERGDKATDWTPAPEDVEGDISSIAHSLSSYVTTETYTAGLANTAEELKSWSRGELVTTSDFGTYSQYMEGQLSQKAGITEISSTATQIVNDAMSGISDTISNVEETFTFDTNGLKIARGGNSIYLQLQNDELAFRTDNSDGGKKAYMTSNAFVLNQLSELRLGNFGFVVRANGSVDFKKVK